MKSKQRKLRCAVIQALGLAALAGFSAQATAVRTAGNLGPVTTNNSATFSFVAPGRSFADYGAGVNLGWSHAGNFHYFQIGSDSDISTGNRFNVSISVVGSDYNPFYGAAVPMQYPGFAVWTSGAVPTTNPTGSHFYNQVRGANEGVNSFLTSGHILNGQDGWIGYANAGYAFFNGEGDHVGGLLTPEASNTPYYTQLSNNTDPTPAANVNPTSSWVDGGDALTALGNATLNLVGLKAGYYLIGLGGSCPDSNLNGQNCDAEEGNSYGYTLTITNTGPSATAVPLPCALWLFGGALASLIGAKGNGGKKARAA